MALAPLALLLAAASAGCAVEKQVAKELDSISDADLASYASKAAAQLTDHAVKLALEKGSKATVATEGALADQILRNVLIPMLSKADVGTVASGSLDTAYAQLKAKVGGGTLDQLYLVSKVALTLVNLPTNPADKINPRYHQALLSFFTSMADALEKDLGIAPPPQPPAVVPVSTQPGSTPGVPK
jgi:hypothetical protein